MKHGALRSRAPATALVVGLALLPGTTSLARAADEDPARFVEFVEEFEAVCVAREGVMIQVRSAHPSRPIRVWLERWHMGVHTGDRGRSDLQPGAEPEKLGCSRTLSGRQEWRIVRARFIETENQ